MRLSRIWRILQVEESVIYRGRRPRLITPSEMCRILHILWKLNSITALLFIQNIFFAQTCKFYSRSFLSLLNDTTLCPGFLGQLFNNLWRQWFNNPQRAALLTLFWRQWFNNLQWTALLTSLVQFDRILGLQKLLMVNYACGFNQSETGVSSVSLFRSSRLQLKVFVISRFTQTAFYKADLQSLQIALCVPSVKSFR